MHLTEDRMQNIQSPIPPAPAVLASNSASLSARPEKAGWLKSPRLLRSRNSTPRRKRVGTWCGRQHRNDGWHRTLRLAVGTQIAENCQDARLTSAGLASTAQN